MFAELGTLLVKRREYRRNMSLSPERFLAMKLKKFRRLVRHAQARSPYYAELIRQRNIDVDSCVPAAFPPLTKSTLMEEFDRIVTDPRVRKKEIVEFLSRSSNPAEMFKSEFRVIHTSGSTGEVGYFVHSRMDWARGIGQMLRPPRPRPPMRRGAPRRKGGRMRRAFYGAVGGHYAGATMMTAVQHGLSRFFIDVRLFEVNRPLAQTIEQLNAFQPDVLSGYTGALVTLARKQQEGVLDLAPRAVGTAAEGVSATDKDVLEAAFGCQVTNTYGSSEHLVMGAVDPDTATMTLVDHELIYEPADDHTLVTNLFNFTMPMIRYRMTDILQPVAIKSEPSSPHLEVESIVGRAESMPCFTNADGDEESINPMKIIGIFVAGVQRFQMHWRSSTSFEFLVCLDSALTAAQQAESLRGVDQRLREILAEKRLCNVSFRVLPVDDISVSSKTGKFQLIVDRRQG